MDNGMNGKKTGMTSLVASFIATLFMCTGQDNTLDSRSDRVTDTLTLLDTLAVHDTVTQTEYETVYDTAYLPVGLQKILYFGMVYDWSGWYAGTADSAYADSIYTSLTAFSDPIRYDLGVSVNGSALKNNPQRSEYLVTSGLSGVRQGSFIYFDMFALLNGTFYENGATPRRDGTFEFRVIVPVYPEDTADAVAHDTIYDEVTLPDSVGARTVATADSLYERLWDADAGEFYHEVKTDAPLTVTWPACADFYTIAVTKLVFGYYGVSPVGAMIDTFVTDTEFVLTTDYLANDTPATPIDELYELIEVAIIPVNGPAPSAWDTLPSFESGGLLLALRSEEGREYLFPAVDTSGLGKSRSGEGRGLDGVYHENRPAAIDVVKRALFRKR